MTIERFNIMQDSQGNYSMLRFISLMTAIMGAYNAALVPFVENAAHCVQMGSVCFALALTGKVTSKLTEKK